MPSPVIPNSATCSVMWRQSDTTSTAVVTFGLSFTDFTTLNGHAPDIALLLRGTLEDASDGTDGWRSITNNAFDAVACKVQPYNGTASALEEGFIATGAEAGTPLPLQVAYLVRLRTAMAGVHGRMYLTGISGDHLATLQRWGSDFGPDVVSAMNHFFAQFTAAVDGAFGGSPYISVIRRAANDAVPVTDLQVGSLIATQRRRITPP